MSTTTHPALDDPNAWVPYRYQPSLVGAYIFTIAFALTTFLHIFQLVKKRTWYFIPLAVGALCTSTLLPLMITNNTDTYHTVETVGYVNRIMSHNNIWSLNPFIVQSLFILVAPALLAASIYIILGRIILLVDGERYSLVRQKWLTKIFVAGDVLSFLLQGAGNTHHNRGSTTADFYVHRWWYPSCGHVGSAAHGREAHRRWALYAALLLRPLRRRRWRIPLPAR
jgi:hypothetical protein